MLSSLAGFIQTGFQIATQQGPLCSEPVQGTGLVLKNIQVADATATSHLQSNTFGGQVISAIRDGFRQGFLDWSPRLMLAMYSCDIQATTEVLGKVYAVVNKRHGHIVAEEMKEGTPFFNVRALVPVVEAFGFADDIRKRTSGAASPQLIFAGFQILDQDPFWVPTTEEELEDLGELADRENIARAYMDTVRIRKVGYMIIKEFCFADSTIAGPQSGSENHQERRETAQLEEVVRFRTHHLKNLFLP